MNWLEAITVALLLFIIFTMLAYLYPRPTGYRYSSYPYYRWWWYYPTYSYWNWGPRYRSWGRRYRPWRRHRRRRRRH